MNKDRLDNVFSVIKKQTKMDYAITNTDNYGDCMTCVNAELAIKFGKESTGIWTKKWTRGMNAFGSWDETDFVYICHDITEEQAKQMIDILKVNGYIIEPEIYNPSKCFKITEEQK